MYQTKLIFEQTPPPSKQCANKGGHIFGSLQQVCKSIQHNSSIIGRFSEEIIQLLVLKFGHAVILIATTSPINESQVNVSSLQVTVSSPTSLLQVSTHSGKQGKCTTSLHMQHLWSIIGRFLSTISLTLLVFSFFNLQQYQCIKIFSHYTFNSQSMVVLQCSM